MALTTPLLYTVNAFDATQQHDFFFNVIAGDQVTGNILTIKDNATLQTVYSQEQTTYKFIHQLPPNTLANGHYYQATIQTKNAKGETSNPSAPVQFKCFSKPNFVISNMPVDNIITNSSFAFAVTYNQTEGETLNSYIYNLYGASGALISSSGLLYNTSSTLPITLSYLFSGFEDNTTYSIEVNGVTENGTVITTGKIVFTTAYTKPNMFSFLFVTNNCKNGYINIRSNVIGIGGVSNPANPIYIDDPHPMYEGDKEVDLRPDGYYVEWKEGYQLTDNWTTRIWGRAFNPNTEIFRFSNVYGDTIIITYRQDAQNAWLELRACHNGWTWGYVAQSNKIAIPSAEDKIFCWLRLVNNLYDLRIENRGVEV